MLRSRHHSSPPAAFVQLVLDKSSTTGTWDS